MNTALILVPARPDLFPEPVAPTATTGLSPEEQSTVQQALAILERHLLQPGVSFLSSDETRDWLRLKMAGLERETFVVLYLNNQHRLLTHETLFAGTLSHVEVQPREVVRSALRYNAAAVIVAHNHVSGLPEPSKADRLITSNLQSTLLLVDVRVLDHFVVGHREIISFSERGWL
ncbi:TPA: DNA repair protein RadC [Klebsiella pneumoniae]|uniref:RadC family protein n=1 Tax=Klebsiella pneumoniae TaxID=573 RepID=UPI000C79A0A7|nr:DNA repair protein RadC [Klebsiella pneumoniae]EIX9106409.1 DNA repair protein RadC [Klebsiella pneumoniae]EIY1879760.1 DNA repair protein RadC [Klebsiella pneumoniae]EKJ7635806.1 DNA repair protein RadC [Klebsiella pneumoniae]MCQ0531704.1 DNA repair protein RadC [Klebsiella pneumoniae]MCQ0574326.1 DNA repair protein RadC [Klebsiella pneumoniae]